MKSAPFDYQRVRDVSEAITALTDEQSPSTIIAGGQSLVPMLNLRVAIIDRLIDISRIEELKAFSEDKDRISLGALVTHAEIEDGKTPDPFSGLLRHVASGISYRSVRHYGTVGGSLALADPAADWPGCFIALDAEVMIAGKKGRRSQALADFILGPYSTSLQPDEILLGLTAKKPTRNFRWGMAKVARKSGAFANSIAYAARTESSQIRVVLSAAGACPYVLTKTAEALSNSKTSEEKMVRAAIDLELDDFIPNADAYERRMHAATILRAIRNMRESQ